MVELEGPTVCGEGAVTGLDELVQGFLSQKRIAVAGVSRNPREAANLIFRKLDGAGYDVVPVNPRADEVEGRPCYPDLTAIPNGVDGVVIATPPSAAQALVEQCATLGIRWVWMHRSFGEGSVSPAAVEWCRTHDIRVIAGACPMMFCTPVDFGHRCIRWLLGVTGGLPASS